MRAKKHLFIRLDRMGDLILTLPADQGLQGVHWWISKGLGFLPRSAVPERRFSERELRPSIKLLYLYWKTLRTERFDTALVFHAPWWISFLLWAARIPVRCGPMSQWHHLFFLNHRLRQQRSNSDRHEQLYNMELAEYFYNELGKRQLIALALRPSLSSEESNILLNQFSLLSKNYIIVHPGMRGSARNWPIENWSRLICEIKKTRRVVITGTSADQDVLIAIKQSLSKQDIDDVLWLDQKLDLSALMSILSHAHKVIAPSTGILHLASSLGTDVVGIYSPVRVQAPQRWRPLGDRAKFLAPNVDCPGMRRCLLTECPLFDCMIKVTVQDALKQVN